MLSFINDFFQKMRPAFNRTATHKWFIIAVIGIIMKWDNFGVTSIIRALNLDQCYYTSLLHFFHSTAFDLNMLNVLWQQFIISQNMLLIVNNRVVIIGDDTYTTKEGKKIPALTAIRQTSETSSKPHFFRGHFWSCLAILQSSGKKVFASPISMKISRGLHQVSKNDEQINSLEAILIAACNFVYSTNTKAYIVLDAFFATATSFITAMKHTCQDSGEYLLHVIIRAKKNVVAYKKPVNPKNNKFKPKKYGDKIKLIKLFETRIKKFSSAEAVIYGKKENIKFLCLDLIWKPIKTYVRFVLAQTSHGNIIIMSSDLNLDAVKIIELYAYRTYIESMFNSFKNLICGFIYHFWSYYMPAKKRVAAKKNNAYISDSNCPQKTMLTFLAIEKFVACSFIAHGLLQILAVKFSETIFEYSFCWLRTESKEIPSDFISKIAFTNFMKNSIIRFRNLPIMRFIISLQAKRCNSSVFEKIS
ncbi:MAG TPA: transposase, partial [Thermotogota bacterium]|jgi:hypothetical protein|nr:transposase [Thermotogota bacterium]